MRKLDLKLSAEPTNTPSGSPTDNDEIEEKPMLIGERIRASRIKGTRGRTVQELPFSPSKAPSQYSSHPGTVTARERRHELMQNPLTREIERAGAADRAARFNAIKKLKKTAEWKAADAATRSQMEDDLKQTINENRYTKGISSK